MINVLVYPRRSSVDNPYLHDLTAPSEQVEFDDWSPRRALVGSYDVLHVHWPESVWNEKSVLWSAVRGLAFIALVHLLRRRGTAVVATIHNLVPHENPHPGLDRWFTRRFDRSVDRAQILAESSRSAVNERFGHRIQIDLVPMGSFVDTYQQPVVDRRRDLILHFGNVRPYKNTSHLLRMFAATPSAARWELLVAGQPSSPALAAELEHLAGQDQRVLLRLEKVPEADVPALHEQAKLAVLPFTTIENSSTVMLALSLGVPVLAPRSGALPDLERVVGGEWLRLYEGVLSVDTLEDALTWADNLRDERPDLAEFDWTAVRGLLESSYRSVIEQRERNR